MASRAAGRRASASARKAVVGVRSTGFAAVATETSNGRSRSTPAARAAGPKAELRALVHGEDAVAAAEGDDADARAAGSRSAGSPRAGARRRPAPRPSTRGSRPAPPARRRRRGPRRPGRRCGRAALRARLVAPDLMSTTGFRRAPRLREGPAKARVVGGPLEIGADDPRTLVLRQRADVVGEADDRLVAAADQGADAEARLKDDRDGLVAMPPDWLMSAIEPGGSSSTSCSAVAKVGVTGKAALMKPTQFGPHRVKPTARQSATISRWSAMPPGARIRKAAGIGDAVAHARGRAIADRLGEALGGNGEDGEMGDPGRSPTAGNGREARQPARAGPVDRPHRARKAELDSRRTVSPPRLPGRSDAPMTATDAARECRRRRGTRRGAGRRGSTVGRGAPRIRAIGAPAGSRPAGAPAGSARTRSGCRRCPTSATSSFASAWSRSEREEESKEQPQHHQREAERREERGEGYERGDGSRPPAGPRGAEVPKEVSGAPARPARSHRAPEDGEARAPPRTRGTRTRPEIAFSRRRTPRRQEDAGRRDDQGARSGGGDSTRAGGEERPWLTRRSSTGRGHR